MIFVSSDHHFHDINFLKYNYNRILKYGKNIKIINKYLIESQNNQITDDDVVYYLGDFCVDNIQNTIDIIKKLNGSVKMILGNHDTFKKNGVVIPNKLEILTDGIYSLNYKSIVINMCHYPLHEQPDYHIKSIHLHGHTHGSTNNYNNRAYDVGYDNNNYQLLTMDYIINKIGMN